MREEASLVKPKALAKAHPDMPRFFQEVFMEEIEIAVLGMVGARRKDLEGFRKRWLQLVDMRQDWWKANRFDFEIPDDVPMWDAKTTDIVGTQDPFVLKIVGKNP
jgi:hypothetical protein